MNWIEMTVMGTAATVVAVMCWHVYRPRPAPAPPTDTDRRAEQLAKARMDLLEHQALAEYHGAMVPMLETRIARLEDNP